MILYVLGFLPFVLLYTATAAWIYRFVYNHNIIQEYSGRLIIPRNRINAYLGDELTKKYHINLLTVNDHDNVDDDVIADQKKATSASNPTETTVVGVVFSASIAFGIELIVLMMCELGDFFNEDTRLTFFKFTIDCLMVFLTVIQPFLVLSLISNNNLIPYRGFKLYFRLVVFGVLFVTWFYFLHKCGDLSLSFSPASSSAYRTRSLIEKKINEISIAGITILAILSGIGSATTPYKLFKIDTLLSRYLHRRIPEGRAYEKEITESDLNNSIQSFNNTNSLLSNRKQDLENVLASNGGTIYNQPNLSSDNILLHNNKVSISRGIINKVQSFASLSSMALNGTNLEEKELNNEIDALIKLRNSMYEDLLKDITKFIQQQQGAAGTSSKLFVVLHWANYSFAAYCLYRIVNVLFVKLPMQYFYGDDVDQAQVIDEREESVSGDALAITLAKLILSLVNLPVTEPQLINLLSFILSGSLFLCSFSNVVITFKSFTKFLPKSHSSASVKNSIKHLVISEMLGIYILATALLIRTNLPANLSHQISKILSLSGSSIANAGVATREVKFIDNWFDKVFAITCVATLALILIKKFIDTNDFDADTYDEEQFIESGNYKVA